MTNLVPRNKRSEHAAPLIGLIDDVGGCFPRSHRWTLANQSPIHPSHPVVSACCNKANPLVLESRDNDLSGEEPR